MQNVTIQLDDLVYQNLVNQIGKENLREFIAQIVKPYLVFAKKSQPQKQLATHRLGGIAPFNVPDDFDDIELTEFYQ